LQAGFLLDFENSFVKINGEDLREAGFLILSIRMDQTENTTRNMAFIDGQNLHLGTKRDGWAIDHVRFRVYLKEKYEIIEAYYFLGFISDKEQRLYDLLKEAGFTLIHKEHLPTLRAAKKGNVDSDIIFEVMKKLVENEPVRKIFIISGDGDYKKLVDFLVSKELFGKYCSRTRNPYRPSISIWVANYSII